jgi:sulfatase modifying factor 1
MESRVRRTRVSARRIERSLLAALALLSAACAERKSLDAPAPAPARSSAASSIERPAPAPAPRLGMVWIPGGPLVAGTPPDRLPRIADEEMPGEQVILKGFYIDVFPYPNEEGAIPLTNVGQREAASLCAERGKRLCSELEWERACKGPQNWVYEYGDHYRPDRCGTGMEPVLRPSGLRVACRSEFGVRDLHGGAWEWTDSVWGRGSNRGLGTVRGGNAPAGELAGRCANAMGRPPGGGAPSVGFRCCAGERNAAEVVLDVRRGKSLDVQERFDRGFAKKLVTLLPEEAVKELSDRGAPAADKLWIWRPIGNEELGLVRVCAGIGYRPACGVAVFRALLERVEMLAWASSAHRFPTLKGDSDPRHLWLVSGDDTGTTYKRISYLWGRVSVGADERRQPKKKRKKRG